MVIDTAGQNLIPGPIPGSILYMPAKPIANNGRREGENQQEKQDERRAKMNLTKTAKKQNEKPTAHQEPKLYIEN